jgi:NAD(P)-dependent dehydrogenase (short-subunit alcohol dehydrogenase family)
VRFEGAVALVTGGASGIGLACATAMAERGADLVIADRNRRRLPEAVAALQARGRRVLGIDCDVSRDEDVERMAARALEAMGRVDILMNNAGVVVAGPVEQIPIADWEWILNINLLGAVRTLRALLPHMLERGSGWVVNTASFAGLVPHNPLTIPYDTSKHAVVGLSAGLALYLRPRGIGVSVLCPGYVATNLAENVRRIGGGALDAGMPDATVTPDQVAERVVEAVEAERFLILSQPEHAEIWARRARDVDRHIARQLEVLAGRGKP